MTIPARRPWWKKKRWAAPVSSLPPSPEGAAAMDETKRELLRRTTVRDHAERLLPVSEWTPEMRNRIERQTNEIAAELRPGEELWEWETGDRQALAGAGGLAIVRDGLIVREWRTWQS